MSFYGRGGAAGGSPMNWYDTQKSEFLRQTQARELKRQLQWYAQNEGVTLPSAGDSLNSTIRSMASTSSSLGGSPLRPSTSPASPLSPGCNTHRPHMTYMDTIRALAACDAIDTSELQATLSTKALTTSRGAYMDPSIFNSPREKSHLKMRTERSEYQEASIKRAAVFGKSK